MIKYKVTVSSYDTDGEDIDLPKELEICVPEDISDVVDIENNLSDEISNITGFCHNGFTYELM